MDRMVSRRAVLGSVAAGGVLLALDACGGRKQVPVNGGPADKVTFVTGFGTTPRECYGFVAKEHGDFREAGIEVTVNAGQPSDANITTLMSGKTDFAAIDWVSAVRGIRTHPGYCVVAAVQYTTLLSMVALKGRGIADPKDLAGRRLGTATGAATQTLFPAYAGLVGVDPNSVQFINFDSGQLPGALAARQIDAMGSYAIDTPGIQNAAKGVEPVVLEYNRYLGDLYGTVIITRRSFVNEKPDLVKRFTVALMRGTRWAVNNPKEAGDLAHRAVATVDPKVMETTMGLMYPYVSTGELNSAKVMRSIALLEQAGLASAGLQPSDVVDFSIMMSA